MRTLTFAQAIIEALAEEMGRDPTVVLWGLDIGPYGGAFAATAGLYEEFGPDRVIDMPISEAGYVGTGVGAAVTGLRPVVELRKAQFAGVRDQRLPPGIAQESALKLAHHHPTEHAPLFVGREARNQPRWRPHT